MERTIERLLQQAYLFDDPRAYRAGVEDAVAALESVLRDRGEPAVLEVVRAVDAARERQPA